MSSLDSEILMNCATCGASVYREHIHRGLAGMWGGRMLCPACLRPKRESETSQAVEDQTEAVPLASDDPSSSVATEDRPPSATADTPLNEPESEESSLAPGHGARRVRSFHAKLSEAALRHMDEQVNIWLQQHPQIEVKFANTTVGIFEGKHSEPNLILTLFY